MNGSWFTTLTVDVTGPVTTLTLNRPERRNAIGPLMVNELLHALDIAFTAPEIRCVVLTGAGAAFCAGGDFAQLSSAVEVSPLPMKGDYADLLLCLMKAPKPVIARVQGHAMGGGLGLVAACTFAIASLDAKLGTPEIDVGLFPMMIMAALARLVPRRKLLDMMLLGQRLSASEAAAIGLVSKAVPPGDLDTTVQELARTLASKSPAAMRLGLAAFAEQDDLALEQALPMLRGKLGEVLATNDAAEGLAAFFEKRAPKWTGR